MAHDDFNGNCSGKTVEKSRVPKAGIIFCLKVENKQACAGRVS